MNWFVNMKVVFKILLLVGFLSCITAGIGYVGYISAHDLNLDSDAQNEAAKELNDAHIMMEKVILMDSMGNDVAASPTPDKVKEDLDTVNEAKATFHDTVTSLYDTADQTQKEHLLKIEDAYKAYEPLLDNIFKSAASVDPTSFADGQKKVIDAMVSSEDTLNHLQDLLQGYIDYTEQDESATSDRATNTYETSAKIILISTIASVVLGGFLGFAMAAYGVSKPLHGTVEVLRHLIEGNLDVEVKGANRKDEVGDVARAAQTFKDVLLKNRAMAEAEKAEQVKKEQRQVKVQNLISNFDSTATQTVSTVASASTQLSHTAEQMAKVADDTNRQSVEVASASEQASHNVQSVASAAEQMAATVQEISKQISLSNGVVRDAMDKAEVADNSSKELVEMSKSVGDIATLIEDIAGQINLLALNATIESARSGEAGKGFAVVANEVKNLATQTAKATEQIRQQLEAVQTTASGVAGSLGEVREAIGKVNESSAAIAAAVEQQSAATQEIVSNMSTATQGVEQINGGIFSIKGGTESTTSATKQVLDAARMLSTQAEKMDQEVKTFLQEILAA